VTHQATSQLELDRAALRAACGAITACDPEIARVTQERLDQKTKPRKSLGALETLACRYAAIRGTAQPSLPKKAVVVMGADHGVAEEGVSAYPQAVTAQMLLNFASGGAAINVLARHADAEVRVVDIGVKEPVAHPAIVAARVAAGTANFTEGPAMTEGQVLRALCVGIEQAAALAASGVTVIGLGEMGIGNTTASSALTAVLTGASVEEVTGTGTGISDAAKLHKAQVIARAIHVNQPDASNALETLRMLGGLEIAGLAGVVIGASRAHVAVIIDGFIASVAALVATRLSPNARDYLIASHRSTEPGHRMVLRALEREPLLDLGMRLGEGTGAALAMTLLDASVKVLLEMATFESAGVADSGA
jgi:nicotinate-nucleotide--dimethylbenzimidazole phosphoribosyltransferase